MKRLPLLSVLVALLLPSVAHADLPTGKDWYKDPRINATWSQAYITESDGTVLHADILRPAGLPADAKTPVLMTIGPYFNHSGELGVTGAAEGAPYTPAGDAYPSEVWTDLFVYGQLMQRGYTFMFVDTRGTGGSTGCLDDVGPGEQADVKESVEWAAKQPWSTGHVGIYGKSYLGATGLAAEAVQPKGLDAIMSMEPVYKAYEYLYTGGVRFVNFAGTPALYSLIADTPGVAGGDDLQYNVNSVNDTSRPGCSAAAIADETGNSDESSQYWQDRDLVAKSKGHTIPMFLTQGFLEDNTKPNASAFEYFNGLGGNNNRAWYGQWDHIRGNEVAEGDHAEDTHYPRFFQEVMRFFDHWVRGVSLADAPVDKDPKMEIETSDGTWYNDTAWPPADADGYTTALRTGDYTDSGSDAGTNEGSLVPGGTVGGGVWTISPPLTSAAHYAGIAKASLQLSAAVPQANLSVDTYDIDKDGNAQLLGRSATLIPSSGKVDLKLYGSDWLIPAGHRVGVRVSGADADWWIPVGTMQPVTITSGTITIPFTRYTRAYYKGKIPDRLAKWKSTAPFLLDASVLSSSVKTDFALPPAQVAPPAPVATAPVAKPVVTKGRLTARISGSRVKRSRTRKIVVMGNAPTGAKIVVHLRRGTRTVATRRTTGKLAAYKVTFKVRRAGTYSASVSAKKGTLKLKALSVKRRVR